MAATAEEVAVFLKRVHPLIILKYPQIFPQHDKVKIGIVTNLCYYITYMDRLPKKFEIRDARNGDWAWVYKSVISVFVNKKAYPRRENRL